MLCSSLFLWSASIKWDTGGVQNFRYPHINLPQLTDNQWPGRIEPSKIKPHRLDPSIPQLTGEGINQSHGSLGTRFRRILQPDQA